MRRSRPDSNYSAEIDTSCKVAYAICKNLYAHQVSGLTYPGLHACVCENNGRGQTCDQMNRAALAVIQTIVAEYSK